MPAARAAPYLLLGCLAAALRAQPAPASAASGSPIVLAPVDVTDQQQAQLNAVDRKTYYVGRDVQAATGSAADILQSIPSVDVDIDGNVSLRGDSHVQILIDGRPSALTNSTNAADVLSSLPADSIERIEVITSPSARYMADGSAGIINIVRKKHPAAGLSGSARVMAGNDARYGGAFSAGYNPGQESVGGSLNYRQDDRDRITIERRTYVDPATGLPGAGQFVTQERFRPLFRIGSVDFEDGLGAFGRITETVDYTDRQQHRNADETVDTLVAGTADAYDRLRDDPEYERNANSMTTFVHDFGRKDDEITLGFRWEHDTEVDHNLYTDVYAEPLQADTSTRTLVAYNDPATEVTADYSNALGPGRLVEAGFDRIDTRYGKNILGTDFDPATGMWTLDPTVTNDFVAEQYVTAFYGTYEQRFGSVTVKPGVRFEAARIDTDQQTDGIAVDQSYARAYPSFHLAWDWTARQQLQFNVSSRVNRPSGDDLNPFSEYQDPNNLRVGNPYLKPEQIESFELGDQMKDGDTTYMGTLFYRLSRDSFTTVSELINPTTLVISEANIGHSDSGGAEFVAAVEPWTALTLNANASIYSSQILADNLGYTQSRSTLTWSGKLSAGYAFDRSTSAQFTADYTGRRLTPQGYRLPSFVANLGLKHELPRRHLALFVTVSDLFNSLKEETITDTPTLYDDYSRRRASRFFAAGAIYTFGGGSRKAKAEDLPFDDKF